MKARDADLFRLVIKEMRSCPSRKSQSQSFGWNDGSYWHEHAMGGATEIRSWAYNSTDLLSKEAGPVDGHKTGAVKPPNKGTQSEGN